MTRIFIGLLTLFMVMATLLGCSTTRDVDVKSTQALPDWPVKPEAVKPEPVKPEAEKPEEVTPPSPPRYDPDVLQSNLKKMTKSLTGLEYLETPKKLQDCSGIFLRVVRKFKKYYPDRPFPDEKQQRSTRLIGKWYHERGELILIRDPQKQAHLIKPGAIMFFDGAPKKKFSGRFKDLFVRGKGIYHMGVVVKVVSDNGKVTGYHLFHGRKDGTPSGTTRYHKGFRKDYGPQARRDNYPPFGNGQENWIAVAHLVNPYTTP